MSEPRFLLVWGCTVHGRSLPAWPTAAGQVTVPDGCWCSWRLLAANNRELGRGAKVHASDVDCRNDLVRGQSLAIGASCDVMPQAGLWTWRLDLAGETFAVAPRAYARQRECHYSFRQFLLGLMSARVPMGAAGDVPDTAALRHLEHRPAPRVASAAVPSAAARRDRCDVRIRPQVSLS